MLTVIIITKNEAQHICRCLASVAWATEIIVVDSGSSDNTVELCKNYTNQVFSADWQGFGIQKQRALDKATQDWVLSIDADEQVTPALRAEIEQAIQKKNFDGFEIPRLSSFCGKDMRHGGWYPDYILRLFKRESGHFSSDVVHERILVQGRLGRLTQPLLHESYVNLEEVLEKINHYSTLGAQQLYNAGKSTTFTRTLLKTLWTFVRTYLLKAAFLDGRHGLMIAISTAEATYYKQLKLLALQETHKKIR